MWAQYVTVKTFVEALRKMVIAELEPQLLQRRAAAFRNTAVPLVASTLAC